MSDAPVRSSGNVEWVLGGQLIASIHEGVIVYGPDLKYQVWNPFMENLTGMPACDVLGKYPLEVFPFLREAGVVARLERVLAGQSADPVDFPYQLPHSGKSGWALDTSIPLRDENDAIVGVIGIVQDITARKKIERDLEAKNAELEKFTYTVSHDLKSPLVTIKGFAGAVMQDIVSGRHDRVIDDLQRIVDAAEKMGNLLNDLLELSRIGAGVNPQAEVHLNETVAQVLGQLAGSIREKNATVNVHSLLPVVPGDRQRLGQVFQNLVENALKFMGAQPEPYIEIGVRDVAKNGGMVHGQERVFFVRDNGSGIAPANLETVFGLFSKLDSTAEGRGIGLALVRRIVEVHGGTVWAESDGPGKGACFCFTLGKVCQTG